MHNHCRMGQRMQTHNTPLPLPFPPQKNWNGMTSSHLFTHTINKNNHTTVRTTKTNRRTLLKGQLHIDLYEVGNHSTQCGQNWRETIQQPKKAGHHAKPTEIKPLPQFWWEGNPVASETPCSNSVHTVVSDTSYSGCERRDLFKFARSLKLKDTLTQVALQRNDQTTLLWCTD